MRAASINDTTRTLIYRCAKVQRIPYSAKLFVRFLTQSTQKGRFRCVLAYHFLISGPSTSLRRRRPDGCPPFLWFFIVIVFF